MKADRVVGVVSIAAGLALVSASAQVDILAGQPTLSARFFPYLLSGLLLACGSALVMRPGSMLFGDVLRRVLDRRSGGFVCLFLIYALTFRMVDFRIGTWCFVLLSMWLLGSRHWLELIVVPLVVAGSTYFIFRFGFVVLLPTWT